MIAVLLLNTLLMPGGEELPKATPGYTIQLRANQVRSADIGSGSNYPLTTTWKNTAGSPNGILTDALPPAVISNGWKGNGTVADPFALACGGRGGYVSLGNLGALPTLCTFEFLYRDRVWDDTLARVYFDTKYNSANVGGGSIRMYQWTAGLEIGATKDDGVTETYVDASPTGIKIPGNQHHVCIGCDQTNNKLYAWVDGVLVLNGSACSTWPTTIPALTLGGGRTLTRWYRGEIGVFRFYPILLTTAQVQANLNADGPAFGMRTGYRLTVPTWPYTCRQGTTTTFTLATTSTFGGSQTYSTDDPAFTNLGGGQFSYTPPTTQLLTVRDVPFTVTDGTRRATVSVRFNTFFDKTQLVADPANPLMRHNTAPGYNDVTVGSPCVDPRLVVNGRVYFLVNEWNGTDSPALTKQKLYYSDPPFTAIVRGSGAPEISAPGGTFDHFLSRATGFMTGATSAKIYVEVVNAAGTTHYIAAIAIADVTANVIVPTWNMTPLMGSGSWQTACPFREPINGYWVMMASDAAASPNVYKYFTQPYLGPGTYPLDAQWTNQGLYWKPDGSGAPVTKHVFDMLQTRHPIYGTYIQPYDTNDASQIEVEGLCIGKDPFELYEDPAYPLVVASGAAVGAESWRKDQVGTDNVIFLAGNQLCEYGSGLTPTKIVWYCGGQNQTAHSEDEQVGRDTITL